MRGRASGRPGAFFVRKMKKITEYVKKYLTINYVLCILISMRLREGKRNRRKKMETWKIEKIKKIVDEAIWDAKKDIASGIHVIDMGEDVKAEGITGYMARRMDGDEVEGRISAQVGLKSAMRQIYKLGLKAKKLQPEAIGELERLESVWKELNLDDPDEEE
jgi:hypothetical protein